MSFHLHIHDRLRKSVSKFPKKKIENIQAALNHICQLPHPKQDPHVKKLSGYKIPTYRLKIGYSYRATFEIRENTVHVVDIFIRQKEY